MLENNCSHELTPDKKNKKIGVHVNYVPCEQNGSRLVYLTHHKMCYNQFMRLDILTRNR